MSRERSAEGREMFKPSRSPPIAARGIGLIGTTALASETIASPT
jgi:hypothetical protein